MTVSRSRARRVYSEAEAEQGRRGSRVIIPPVIHSQAAPRVTSLDALDDTTRAARQPGLPFSKRPRGRRLVNRNTTHALQPPVIQHQVHRVHKKPPARRQRGHGHELGIRSGSHAPRHTLTHPRLTSLTDSDAEIHPLAYLVSLWCSVRSPAALHGKAMTGYRPVSRPPSTTCLSVS
jgi:hypothetical protein